jgi:hypothetical protein
MHILLAQQVDSLKRLNNAGATSGYKQVTGESGANLGFIIATIINSLLGLVGVIFLVLIIYSGYTWMTAGGDEGKVEKAKETIGRAVIGLVIVLLAYAIANFIIPTVLCATGVSSCSSGVSV